DKTYNYNSAGTAIKTTTLFTYTADTLTKSVTYRNDTGSVTNPGITVKRSITLYTGNEGEEKATTTYNYNFAGTAIKTTTIFTYNADTLSESITYRNRSEERRVGKETRKRSVTYYYGNDGEKKA